VENLSKKKKVGLVEVISRRRCLRGEAKRSKKNSGGGLGETTRGRGQTWYWGTTEKVLAALYLPLGVLWGSHGGFRTRSATLKNKEHDHYGSNRGNNEREEDAKNRGNTNYCGNGGTWDRSKKGGGTNWQRKYPRISDTVIEGGGGEKLRGEKAHLHNGGSTWTEGASRAGS